MRNLHQIIQQDYGLEALRLLRDWERLRLQVSDYKNHRIFSLRCLHKDLVPVSIKLKTTSKTDRAKKIIRKAEKDLLQARIKSINSILDNAGKQTELCRSKLASIISTERLRECQGFIDKVGEIRFTKVKQRQQNKFSILLNRKEGNITGIPTNLASQAGRQGNNLVASQAGRQANSPPGEGSTLVASQAIPPRPLLTFPLGKRVIHPRQLLIFPLGKTATIPWQTLTFPHGKEVVYQLPRQALTFP